MKMRLFNDEQAKLEIEKLTKRASEYLKDNPIDKMRTPYYKSLCTRIQKLKSGWYSNKVKV